MKIFDFEKSYHCPERVEWLKKNRNIEVSEEEFLLFWQATRHLSRAKQNSKANKPSKVKRTYRNLKENFGFFVIK